MIPSISSIGTGIIDNKKIEESSGYSESRISDKGHFLDYASFKQYASTIGHKSNNGLPAHISSIIDWIMSSGNKTISSFECGWQTVQTFNAESSKMQQKVASILKSETSFYGKQFMPYLKLLMDDDEISKHSNNTELLSMTDTFANDQFSGIDINEFIELQQFGAQSFGGGIGFGVQIYCNEDEKIFDGGAGGGGGYNLEDIPQAFEYGGGGGIQINNVSIGGGTGFEKDRYSLDKNADRKKFYDVEMPYFLKRMQSCDMCEALRIESGGGSGSGLTDLHGETDLVSWSYYFLKMNVDKECETK